MKKYFLILACILLVSCSVHEPSLVPIDDDRGYKKQMERRSDMTCEEIRKEGQSLGVCFRPRKANEHQIEKYEDATCIGILARDSKGEIIWENKICK